MGIILRGLSTNDHHRRMTQGIVNNRFSEFTEENDQDQYEQTMMEEGVYSKSNRADVLTMQNLDDTARSI